MNTPPVLSVRVVLQRVSGCHLQHRPAHKHSIPHQGREWSHPDHRVWDVRLQEPSGHHNTGGQATRFKDPSFRKHTACFYSKVQLLLSRSPLEQDNCHTLKINTGWSTHQKCGAVSKVAGCILTCLRLTGAARDCPTRAAAQEHRDLRRGRSGGRLQAGRQGECGGHLQGRPAPGKRNHLWAVPGSPGGQQCEAHGPRCRYASGLRCSMGQNCHTFTWKHDECMCQLAA